MMTRLERLRAKAEKHNAIVDKLEAAGFMYCSGIIFTGESFNRETYTWQPNSQRIGELAWDGDEWAVKPYEGFAHLLEGVYGFTQNGGGESDGP